MKSAALLILLGAAACGADSGDVKTFDARPAVDASRAIDGAPVDAGPGGGIDAPLAADARPAADAAPAFDAPPGSSPDAGPGVPTTAFRVDQMMLRDPHGFIFGCNDVTDTPFFGLSVNGIVDDMLNTDADDDQLLDLSVIVLMKPLETRGGFGTNTELVFGDCSAPASTTMCSGHADDARYAATYGNQAAGTCLGVVPGSESSGEIYKPDNYAAIGITTAGGGRACGASDSLTLTLNVAGALIKLEGAQVAARYADQDLVEGLIRGFISEDDAEMTHIPVPILGSLTVSSLFWGGSDNGCDVVANDPTPGDIDIGPDGVTTGWWVYLDFHAHQVPYSEK